MTDPHLEAAHRHCTNNHNELALSKIAGCFHCQRWFPASEIRRWRGLTAMCPYCGIDSVIGDKAGYPPIAGFLRKMHEYWFTPRD